ncbi:hypothetical protein SB783_37460 [Paraburkholderia sp. SIMBA_009]
MDKGVKRLLDSLGALDRREFEQVPFDELDAAPTDSDTVCGAAPSDALLRYRDAIIEQSLVGMLQGDRFDICPLDHLAEAIEQSLGRPKRAWPNKTAAQTAIEPALRVLHCKSFDAMSPIVREGLPATLLEYFGLDDASGVELLGEDAWARVAKGYRDFAMPLHSSSDESPANPVDGVQAGVGVDECSELRPGVLRRLARWVREVMA